MRRFTAFFACFSLMMAVAFPATAVTPRSDLPAPDVAFQGSQAELVGYLMPRLMEKTGHQLRLAPPSVTVALQRTFQGSQDFLWTYTLVSATDGARAFTFTLPSSIERIRGGELALGILENGQLTRALVIKMNFNRATHEYDISFASPTGTSLTHLSLGLDANGRWLASYSDLFRLGNAFYPNAAKGAFDPLIDALEGILDLLYMVKDIINMGICAVNQLIYMFENLNTCGWGATKPGGGNFVRLLICSIEDVIYAIDAITSQCL